MDWGWTGMVAQFAGETGMDDSVRGCQGSVIDLNGLMCVLSLDG